MCGIFGLLGNRDLDQIKAAHRTIKNRGPDGEGFWFDNEKAIAFCHHRLAIVDLSPAGAQPMTSANGRYVLTYNGEIYNFQDLKKQLQTTAWRGHSDTEILVQCIEEWGIPKTLDKIEGMYAFSVWNKEEKKLTLVRDRLGEKPLYYGKINNQFVFSSELKPIIHLFKDQLSLDDGAIADFFTRSCITGDKSIFSQIKKLPAGTSVEFSFENHQVSLPKKYWSLDQVPLESLKLEPADATRQLEGKLQKAIEQQKIADVPLGAFLSGGVDSSLVVALMQKNSSQKVKTFSMGFFDKHYDEAKYAKAVALHLGTEHEELYVSEKEFLEVIPDLPTFYDEPFADSSEIPTVLVSKMAKRHVTVALSGDGGDELFAGYTRHQFAHGGWKRVAPWPAPLRSAAAAGIESLSPAAWKNLFALISPGVSQPHEKIYKLAGVLRSARMEDFYKSVSTHWQGQLPLQNKQGLSFSEDWAVHTAAEMTKADAKWYLADDILTKVDRGAMSQSLEGRAPFLNKHVVEMAFALPMSLKIRDGQSKWILRQILYQYVPKNLIERPKMGFSVPLDSWLRKELKEWAWELIHPTALAQQNILDEKMVLQKWHEHQSGERNWQTELWDILMFQAWRRKYQL